MKKINKLITELHNIAEHNSTKDLKNEVFLVGNTNIGNSTTLNSLINCCNSLISTKDNSSEIENKKLIYDYLINTLINFPNHLDTLIELAIIANPKKVVH